MRYGGLHKMHHNYDRSYTCSFLSLVTLVVTLIMMMDWSLAHTTTTTVGTKHRCMHEEMYEQERQSPTGIHRQLQEKVHYSPGRWRAILEEKASILNNTSHHGVRRSLQQVFQPMRLSVRYIDDLGTDRVCRSAGQVCFYFWGVVCVCLCENYHLIG